jgi:glycosyltransferase involved in cell wall biosynthesis
MVAPLCTWQEIPKLNKEKIILSVGRFFRQLHAKRQDVLVEGFRQLIEHQPELMKGWTLVLMGGADDLHYIDELKTAAKGLPIEILPNAARLEIEKYYKAASIYWHAAGYEVNEAEHPERTEHFGITTVEAMSAGCIPVVVLKGGQVEVVGPKLAELGWETLAELRAKTLRVIEHPADHAGWQAAAYTQVEQFSPVQFQHTLTKILPTHI